MRKGYYLLELDKASSSRLKKMAKHEVVYCHHVTLCFMPNEAQHQYYQNLLGEIFPFRATQYRYSNKVDCVIVELPCDSKEFPHVTLSCADGVKPVEANDLINATSQDIRLSLKGVVKFFEFK